MLYLLIKKYNLLFLFTLLLMSGNEVVAQSSSNLNSGKTFSRFDENVELKEKIYQLKYSDPNLAISICLNKKVLNSPTHNLLSNHGLPLILEIYFLIKVSMKKLWKDMN